MENIAEMKRMVLIFGLIVNSLFCFAPVRSQQFTQKPVAYPKGYFRNPLSIPIKLAANFGELRTNHYHMGFDIRTNQKENLPVYAAAEGYVSRVKIEKGGFGRAIYITHPNGYTTLYAHLNNFYTALNENVIDRQYEEEQWEQDVTFSPDEFPVTKGQFIAYSGNTGGSAGPHLHFEIRDTKTGSNLNPWLFDMGLTDNIPPSLYRLYYYDRRYSTYETVPMPIGINGGRGRYYANSEVVNLSSPNISFGITAEDKTTPVSFDFGIYEASLTIDDTLRSVFRMNDFSYDETRYLNAGIDYKNRLSGGSYIQHLSRLPGNKFSGFFQTGDGIFKINDSTTHAAKIEIKDAAGNASFLQFSFRYNETAQKDKEPASESILFTPNTENVFAAEDIVAAFPSSLFYDNLNFVHKIISANATNAVSATHSLHNYKVPVHDFFSVRIKPTIQLPDSLMEYVVMKMESNKKKDVVKGKWKNGWLEASFRSLGDFTLLLDTLPPRINLYGWANGAYLGSRKGFAIAVADNLGEIKNVNGYVDGKWILFSKKDNLIIHTFDGRITPGRHELKIVAEDEAGNVLDKIFTFGR